MPARSRSSSRCGARCPSRAATSRISRRDGSVRMRDFVVQLRKKLDTRFTDLAIPGISRTAQPFLMYRNRLYAANRTSYNRAALQVEGEWKPEPESAPKKKAMGDQADADEGNVSAPRLKANAPDADLHVPAGQRAKYEAAFARFCRRVPGCLLYLRAWPLLPRQHPRHGPPSQRRLPQPDGLFPRRSAALRNAARRQRPQATRRAVARTRFRRIGQHPHLHAVLSLREQGSRQRTGRWRRSSPTTKSPPKPESER